MKKLITYTITFFYMISLFMPSVAFAEESSNYASAPKSIILFNDDQTFNLPKNEVSYWFNIPKGAELSECYVNLHITYSNILIDTRSNVSVLINGSPVDTKWVSDLKKTTTNWWEVSIPVTKLRVNAINEIKIQSNQRSIEGDCADIDNTGNWIVIHKDTHMRMNIDSYPDALLSNVIPIYGDNLVDKYSITSDFVLPKEVDDNSISSLLKLTSSIGRIHNDKINLDYNVDIGSSEYKSFKNKIFLGPINEWSNSSQLSLPIEELGGSQGFISISSEVGLGTKETPTTVNDITLFNTLITGENQDGINKAINFFASKQLMDQIKKNSVILNSDIKIERTSIQEKDSGLYKFSDFGYGNLNLAGAFHQKTYLTFVQPQGRESVKGSYLNIKFNHSKILVSDRSIMTVYINNIPVNSAKLSVSNAEDGTLKVNIPEEALKSNIINVGIECYNYLGAVDCSKDYAESAWTMISSDSEICLLPGNEVIQPTLNSFPNFYTKQSLDVPQVVFGLSDSLDYSILEIISLIASRAGQFTNEIFDWNILHPHDILTSAQEKMDMVYLGSYSGINLPQSIKDELYVVPMGDGTFSIKEGLQIQPETLHDKVLFQVVKSPWDTSKRLYVVMYDKTENLKMLKKVLSDGELLNKMTGQIAIVDSDCEIHSFPYEEKAIVTQDITLRDRIYKFKTLTHLPWWLLLTFFVMIIIGLMGLIALIRSKGTKKK